MSDTPPVGPGGSDAVDRAALEARFHPNAPVAEVLGRSRRVIGRLQLIGLMLLVLFGALVFACAYTGTAGPAKTATDFLALTAARGPAASYAAAAPEFRAGVTLADWTEATTTAGLARFAGATWNARRVEGRTGSVRGTVRLADKRRLPAAVELVQDRSGWRVSAVRLSAAAGRPSGNGQGGSAGWSATPSPPRTTSKGGSW